MTLWKLVSSATALVLSSSVNASILNTLNGVDYEWLEVTATEGFSRLYVDRQLNDPSSALYGYEYASRALVEDLLHSYANWDGVDGWHGESAVLFGLNQFIDDFGETYRLTQPPSYIEYTTTVDGYTVERTTGSYATMALYGQSGECGPNGESCFTSVRMYDDPDINPVMVYQGSGSGWDATDVSPVTVNPGNVTGYVGSFLVKDISGISPEPSPVPVPTALWLFGSGLIGLAGLARRKKA